MDYKSELQSNNAQLESILSDVNALPEASGGGASVETTTVNLSTTGRISQISATTLVDGAITSTKLSSGTTTITNAVVDSIFVVITQGNNLTLSNASSFSSVINMSSPSNHYAWTCKVER